VAPLVAATTTTTELVEITMRPTRSTREGWVEGISHGPSGSQVQLVLADGTLTMASVAAEELDWLELGVDQIVHLRRLPSAGDPGVGLLRECVDLGG
jgi:hypothetical protein